MKLQNAKPWASRTAKYFVRLMVFVWAMSTAHAAYHFQTLFNFGDVDVRYLPSALIQGSDGALYGALDTSTNTIVFKIRTDGARFTVLHNFPVRDPFSCSFHPIGPLLEGKDGALYGTTTGGNVFADGCTSSHTIFKLDKDGSNYTVIYVRDTFPGRVEAGLVEGTDGALYGVTEEDGAHNAGTVFKLPKDGSNYTVLHNFGATPADGQYPRSRLILGEDGALYGTTSGGGAFTNQDSQGLGTTFRLNQDGSDYRVVHDFGGPGDGWGPITALTEGSDDALYGRTLHSGPYKDTGPTGGATLFKLKKDRSDYTVLHSFGAEEAGEESAGTLIDGADGALYGTTPSGGTNDAGTIFTLNEDGSGYTVLHDFGTTTPGDGSMPTSGLIRGRDGVIYGTTYLSSDDFAGGTLFKLWPRQTPDMIGVTATNNSVEVSFAGESGGRYQVLCSTDLTTWLVRDTVTMPATGVYKYSDHPPPGSAAYYRAAWVP